MKICTQTQFRAIQLPQGFLEIKISVDGGVYWLYVDPVIMDASLSMDSKRFLLKPDTRYNDLYITNTHSRDGRSNNDARQQWEKGQEPGALQTILTTIMYRYPLPAHIRPDVFVFTPTGDQLQTLDQKVVLPRTELDMGTSWRLLALVQQP